MTKDYSQPVDLTRRQLLRALGIAATVGLSPTFARSESGGKAGPDLQVTHKSLDEPILDPQLPIVDAHHHLWFMRQTDFDAIRKMDSPFDHALEQVYQRNARYLLDEFLADATSGHNVVASVFCECDSMYRLNGPAHMRSVGEVEFVNGVAAMAASGTFGPVKACAAIVGSGAALALGDGVQEVLHAHIQAGDGRYRGVRARIVHDPDAHVIGRDVTHITIDEKFLTGFKHLHRLGLSFDVWALEPQLPELIDLARRFPSTQMIVNHCGMPLGVGRFEGRREERFPIWRQNMRALANCGNVVIKLGGLALPTTGFKSFTAVPRYTSEQLAAEWKPYIETCIEIFGARAACSRVTFRWIQARARTRCFGMPSSG